MLTKELLEKNIANFEKIVRDEYKDLRSHHFFSSIGIDVFSRNDINIISANYSKCIERLKTLPPSFQNVDIDILNCLFNMLYDKSDVETKWAEKLLLFLEVRHKDLKVYINEKFSKYIDRELFLALLISFIVEYGFIYDDLRFLNVALKVIELLKFYDTNYILGFTNANRLSQNVALMHVKNLQLIKIQLGRI